MKTCVRLIRLWRRSGIPIDSPRMIPKNKQRLTPSFRKSTTRAIASNFTIPVPKLGAIVRLLPIVPIIAMREPITVPMHLGSPIHRIHPIRPHPPPLPNPKRLGQTHPEAIKPLKNRLSHAPINHPKPLPSPQTRCIAIGIDISHRRLSIHRHGPPIPPPIPPNRSKIRAIRPTGAITISRHLLQAHPLLMLRLRRRDRPSPSPQRHRRAHKLRI